MERERVGGRPAVLSAGQRQTCQAAAEHQSAQCVFMVRMKENKDRKSTALAPLSERLCGPGASDSFDFIMQSRVNTFLRLCVQLGW